MEIPTTTSAAPVAAPGIIRNRGLTKQQSRNRKEVATLLKPVRLPDSIPDADSAKQLTVEIPKIEPTSVEQESTRNTRPNAGKFPSSSSRFALPASANPEPMVPKKSLIRSIMINGTKLSFSAPKISTWNATSLMALNPPIVKIDSGRTVTPMGIPIIVVRMIPIRSAPRILYSRPLILNFT